jgi:hypothetical protein
MEWMVRVTSGPRFAPTERTPVPTGEDTGWTLEPDWAERLEEKSSCLCRGSNVDRAVSSQTLYWLMTSSSKYSHESSGFVNILRMSALTKWLRTLLQRVSSENLKNKRWFKTFIRSFKKNSLKIGYKVTVMTSNGGAVSCCSSDSPVKSTHCHRNGNTNETASVPTLRQAGSALAHRNTTRPTYDCQFQITPAPRLNFLSIFMTPSLPLAGRQIAERRGHAPIRAPSATTKRSGGPWHFNVAWRRSRLPHLRY